MDYSFNGDLTPESFTAAKAELDDSYNNKKLDLSFLLGATLKGMQRFEKKYEDGKQRLDNSTTVGFYPRLAMLECYQEYISRKLLAEVIVQFMFQHEQEIDFEMLDDLEVETKDIVWIDSILDKLKRGET